MGIFSKKPKISVCDMCGKADVEGCGSAHKHVEQISAEQPSWLPADWRAQGLGEYTFLCLRCNSYPAMKWPGTGGADASMMIHLGKAHHVGQFAATGARMEAMSGVTLTMVPLG